MGEHTDLPVLEFILILFVLCFVSTVDGGECCRTSSGSFWCPDFCCAGANTDVDSAYPFYTYQRLYCCSNPRVRAPYGYRTTFCSSWFSHSHNLWVPILVAVVVIALLVAFGICCCCIPGFCICC